MKGQLRSKARIVIQGEWVLDMAHCDKQYYMYERVLKLFTEAFYDVWSCDIFLLLNC